MTAGNANITLICFSIFFKNPKTNSSQSFLSSPTMSEQRKMDTSHGELSSKKNNFIE
jgi:hypothetical protein